MVKKLVFVIMILCAFNLSYAQFDQNSLIEEVLELSGAKKQIEQIKDIVNAQSAQHQNELEPEMFEKFSRVMNGSYRGDVLYKNVVNYFKDNFDQGRLLVILDWLNSPLSQKMTRLEVAASTVEAMRGMNDFAVWMQQNPPAQERLALVQKLDETVGGTKLVIEMNLVSFRGIAKAIDPTLPPEKRLQKGQLDQLCGQMRTQLQLPLKNSTLVSYLYTYRSVSDYELKTYINFWESEAGMWFNRVYSEAVLGAMANAAEEAGGRMIGLLPQ